MIDVSVPIVQRTMSGPAKFVAATILLFSLVGCGENEANLPRAGRPVQVFFVEASKLTNDVQLSGEIQAEKNVALAFRIDGRVVERPCECRRSRGGRAARGPTGPADRAECSQRREGGPCGGAWGGQYGAQYVRTPGATDGSGLHHAATLRAGSPGAGNRTSAARRCRGRGRASTRPRRVHRTSRGRRRCGDRP